MNSHLRLSFLYLLLLPQVSPAVQTERILVDSFPEWAEGEVVGAALQEPGVLLPAPTFLRRADLKTSMVWNGAFESGGSVLLGTGKPGAVWRLDNQGNLRKLTEFSEPDVYSVVSGSRGEVYAAPSPGGKIFRLGTKGKFEEYFKTGEEYVWDMKVTAKGVLYVATGPKGRIYRITGKDEGQVWFDADEPHIRRLAIDSAGAVLAGTAGKGLLYRVVDKERGVVLLDSGKEEIAGLAVDAGGTIVVAASSGSGAGSGNPDRPRSIRIINTPDGNTLVTTGLLTDLGKGGKAIPASHGSTDIYAIKKDLFPTKIREIKDEILALTAVGLKVYGASAVDGKIYQFTGAGTFGIGGQIEGSSVVSLLARDGQLLALTQNQVWSADASSRQTGRYRSRVFDTKLFAQWGVMQVRGEGDWTLRTRSGNTSDPDKSWNPWLPLSAGKIASPAARYLQFEVQLSQGNVEQVEVFYLPQNLPPKLDLLTILAADTAYEPLSMPVPPPQPLSADQLAKGNEGPNQPPLRFQPTLVRGARSVAWQASDPNGDPMTYSVYLRHEGGKAWELLAGSLEETVFSWDSTGWEDGSYRVKIAVTDAPGNPPDRALETEKVSESFTIDHTPPVARVLRQVTQEVEIAVVDRTSRLAQSYVSYDGRDFRPVLPVDGMNDSPSETYKIPRKAGKTLYFRAEDEHGNVTGVRVLPD